MFRRLESFACFAAALLALVIEGCFVYWMHICRIAPVTISTATYSGQWIGPTLPHCWLLGAIVALFYYLCRARQAEAQEAVNVRHSFMRVWYWFLALASAQGCALYLSYYALVHR